MTKTGPNTPTHVEGDDLRGFIKGGVIDRSHYSSALGFFRDGPAWMKWSLAALLALGVGHVLSGIMFFFAYNWADIAPMHKLGLVAAAIAACVLGWLVLRLDSPPARAFGIGATILTGVFLAVFGQIYQTPVAIYTPFVLWAMLTVPFVVASKSHGHWAVWLIIACIACFAFINEGVRHFHGDFTGNALHVWLAAECVGALVLYDWFIKKDKVGVEWFRLLLIFGAILFAFIGFTEGFWDFGRDGGHMILSLLSISLIGALTAYLYKYKPSVATLSLAAFGISTMAGQLGLKVFTAHGFDDVGGFLTVFLWFAGVTTALAFALGYFNKRFGKRRSKRPEDDTPILDDDIAAKTTIDLAAHIDVDSAALGESLLANTQAPTPWYIDMFLGIGGVLTAIMGILFFGFLLAVVLSVDSPPAVAVFGAAIYGAGVFLRRKTDHMFARHMLNTVILSGGMVLLGGIILMIDGEEAGLGIAAMGVSTLTLFLVRDRIMEFLMAAGITGSLAFLLFFWRVPMPFIMMSLICTALGIGLLTQPFGKRLYDAAGSAFLVSPVIFAIFWGSKALYYNGPDFHPPHPWAQILASMAIMLAAIIYLNRVTKSQSLRPPLFALIPLTLAMALMPLGGAAALLTIVTGYILGSRSLAIVGVLLQIYFLTMFYYEMSISLLNKSILLAVTGAIFLGIWAIFARKSNKLEAIS
ncbi:MAG: DUF4401 domain-containing protein [Robiginitomaculum sp.]